MPHSDLVIQGRIPVRVRVELPDAEPPPSGFPFALCLHGYGESAASFAERLALPEAGFARVFLDAPSEVVVGKGDERRIGRSWYAYTGDQPAFLESLERAEGFVVDAMECIVAGSPLDPRRAVMIGYSQGGYLGSWMAFRHRSRFAGLVAISCRVKTEVLDDEIAAATGYPVLVVHGERDPATAFEPQARSVGVLESAGVDVNFHVHDGGHGIRRAVLPVIADFVEASLA